MTSNKWVEDEVLVKPKIREEGSVGSFANAAPRNIAGLLHNIELTRFLVERIVPGTLPSSVTGPVILVVSKADGDEERESKQDGYFPGLLSKCFHDTREVEKQLEILNQRLKELQKEISQMERSAEEKQQLVSKLQEKSELFLF
ncbi:hypothetical protein F0562_006298 [Nyssa sinensis]|uniref:Uncharacterized protein n=1 Tax=Nyssa sinensis TaxID=561372 RepID=A0A5J5AMY3_9ASTE|nr:hypothetical protein F0562_006298 [Nyssa sinensis]